MEGLKSVQRWLLPSFYEVLTREPPGMEPDGRDASQTLFPVELESPCKAKKNAELARLKAEREWKSAIASLEDLLRAQLVPAESSTPASVFPQGVVLAGPVPLFCDPAVLNHFQIETLAPQSLNPLALMPFRLPGVGQAEAETTPTLVTELPLVPGDPLAQEQFCLVLTRKFSLAMALGKDEIGNPRFDFSFDPERVEEAWQSLRARLLLTHSSKFHQLNEQVDQFAPLVPDYRLVTRFSRLLMHHLPQAEEKIPPAIPIQPIPVSASQAETTDSPADFTPDVEMLKAFAHEVRTPLTTIRTLTRSLLRRKDLNPQVIKRLEVIDNECTEQIDRMELIFRAVELETEYQGRSPHCPASSPTVPLTSMSVTQVFQNSIPRWQKQASRRNLTLDVQLPQKLPKVVSNPGLLDQVLTGLIETFAKGVPCGSHIQVEVTPAGDQLKLQLQSSQPTDLEQSLPDFGMSPAIFSRNFQPVGQMLSFQPETGSLSLNLQVTKNLFQALGGRLIVRQRPQQGEVLTVFLPVH